MGRLTNEEHWPKKKVRRKTGTHRGLALRQFYLVRLVLQEFFLERCE